MWSPCSDPNRGYKSDPMCDTKSSFRSLQLKQERYANVAIEHKRLGKHGVFVSNICLGTMNFGWHTAQEESFKIMDRSLELGINFFDTTAEVANRAEEILGRWFAQGGGRRDAVILA